LDLMIRTKIIRIEIIYNIKVIGLSQTKPIPS